MVAINYWAVLVSAAVAIGIGYAWYGPIFGKQWIALMGWSMADMEAKMKQGVGPQYVLQAVGALLMAFVLLHALVFASSYLHESGVIAGLETGFWNWIGFIVPVTLGSVLWDGKPWKLWVLNAAYYLIVLLVMGLILALWV